MRSAWIGLALLAMSTGLAYAGELFRLGGEVTAEAPEVQLKRQIDVDWSQLHAKSTVLTLPLPDGPPVLAQRTSIELRPEGLVWRGKIDQRRVVLTVHQGLLAGFIEGGNGSGDGGNYEIRPQAQRGHTIAKIDPSHLPRLGEPLRVAATGSQAMPSAGDIGKGNGSTEKMATVVSVLIAYTSQARTAAGGQSQIEAALLNAMDVANSALGNSQVASRFDLLHMAEVPLANPFTPDLDLLRTDPTLTSLRQVWGADLVAVIFAAPQQLCGQGYLMESPGAGFAPFAYSFTAFNCLNSLTLPHELGHNLGLEHDPANGGPPAQASYPWSYGHFVDRSFRTIMSYTSGCASGLCGIRVNFSNPNVSISGQPSGIDGERDNHRTLNLTMPIASRFRTSTATAPAAPSNLAASASNDTAIDLSWADNSNNETAFDLQRRTSGNFATIASLTANTATYRDTGLTAGASYTYRVRARNSVGSSAYSNAVSVSTVGEPAPILVAQSTSSSSLRLTWVDLSTSELGYEIESRSLGDAVTTLTADADAESIELSGLFSEVTYSFRIRAILPTGTTAWSNTATLTLPLAPPQVCVPNGQTLCLNQGRFRVEVIWRDFENRTGDGQVVPTGAADSGLFWFFAADNWEMLVKVLDACGLNQRFWVFSAATTNVEYILRVVDSATGRAATYFNPLGNAAAALTDTDALATCP